VSPILGIIASQNYVRIPPTSYESIATVTVGSGGTSAIDFTSIPATYTHLQIRGIGRTDRADVRDYYKVQFNLDTGSNYAWHQLYGSGETVNAQAGTSATEIRSFRVAGANDTASIFGAQSIDILDYANTNKYKTLRSLGGIDTNGAGEISLNSGLWQNTNAITSIQIKPGGGTNWVQYTQFALYGIK
jgi:hypothetical protein